MANIKPSKLLFLLLLLLLFTPFQGGRVAKGSKTRSIQERISSHSTQMHLPDKVREGKKMKERSLRRLMIGSTAPTCTYNECRKCRYKCRAEQVPVEGSDPINSAYHYRCVCHI